MSKAIFLFGFLLVAYCASTALEGGYFDADVDEEDVVAASKHASKSLSKQFASKNHHTLAKVIRAQKQVVAGMNYRMDIIVGETNCRKDEVEYEEADACDYKNGISTYKKCTVVVYRNLQGEHQLTSSGCILASKKDL